MLEKEKFIDNQTESALIDKLKFENEYNVLPSVYAWFLKNTDFDYSSISPIRNVPYELMDNEMAVHYKDLYGNKHTVRLTSIYRERFGLPLTIYTVDTFQKEYDILKENFPEKFKDANKLIDGYISDLKKLGINNYKDYDLVSKVIDNKRAEEQKEADANGYHTHQYIGNSENLAYAFKSVCDRLGIDSEVVYGYVDSDKLKHNCFTWNAVIKDNKVSFYDIANALMARDNNEDITKYYGFDADTQNGHKLSKRDTYKLLGNEAYQKSLKRVK
jgi:hypothetical protein